VATGSLILALLLGLGLAASTGLNTFLPLLLLAASARFGIAGISLGERFEWLSSDVAIIVLIIACIAELVADKVPAVDHFLDSIGTFVRPVAGAVASASVLTGLDPTVAAVVGIMVGAPTSLGFHTLKAGTRMASSAATFGCANPFISLAEDVVSLVLSVIAIFAPVIVPIALGIFIFALWQLVKRVRGNATATAGS
jgi:uncharacterized membrane protein